MEAAQNTQGKTLGLFSTTRMTSEVPKGSKIHSARSSCTEFLSNRANMIKHVDPLATDFLLRVRDSKTCP
jgi:hypothetical protein